ELAGKGQLTIQRLRLGAEVGQSSREALDSIFHGGNRSRPRRKAETGGIGCIRSDCLQLEFARGRVGDFDRGRVGGKEIHAVKVSAAQRIADFLNDRIKISLESCSSCV